MTRPLSEVARECRTSMLDQSQGKPGKFAHAWPYLDAMLQLNSITENYYNDTGRSVVLYFLSNAGTWRGPEARRLKAELWKMVG